MKLDKLRWIYSDIFQEMEKEGLGCGCFYGFQGKWFDIYGREAAEDVRVFLNLSMQEGVAYRQAGSNSAWFYFNELDFVVYLSFAKAPKAPTRSRYRQKISSVFEASINAYKVAHNSLTGLLAKDAFGAALDDEVAVISSSFSSSDDAQESSLPRSIAVVALDIDHFKQVNDTWGHYYGDQVLKVFGRRLEEVAQQILVSGVGNPSVHLGHPSGEEFLVVISANASKEQFSEWASMFRARIADNVLPTDAEWASLVRDATTEIVEPPPLQDRSITTSVGVTWHTNVSWLDGEAKPGSVLLERADTALYRAKAAGRDQVIFYDEILASCGRVLEHDASTGVIAIDIGSNVGVSVGQEFKVFPLAFTGLKKFTINDGRTTRTLGTYPRVDSGRLVVFNAQPEISFACRSPHDSGQAFFEIGSHLEAIPAGSIRHLLPNFSRYFSVPDEAGRGDGLQSMQEYLEKSATDGKTPFAIVFRFSRESEYSRKYGTASLNYALARLFKSAQTNFHAAKYVEVLDRSSICVVGDQKAYKEKMVGDFIGEMAEDLPELGVLAGVFCKADRDRESKDSSLVLNYAHAMDFARFAASELGREPDVRVRHFGKQVGYDVLQAHREARSFKTGYADFEKLVELGVVAASLQNLAGLMSGSLGRKRQALENYKSAMDLSPATLIYKSNFCTAALRLGEVDQGLEVMNSLPDSEIDKLQGTHAYGYVCYAVALARAANAGSKYFDAVRFKRIAATALTLPDASGEAEQNLISSVLERV